MRSVAGVMRVIARPPARDSRPLHAVVEEAHAILIVALAEIGDTVLAVGFVEAVACLAPRATITVVVRPGLAPLMEGISDRVRAVEYDPRAGRALRPLVLPLRAHRFARRALAATRFDIAIVPRWDTDHHLASAVAVFSRASRRVAFGERSTPRKCVLNAGFDSLFTDIVNDTIPRHEVERLSVLIERLGGGAGAVHPRLRVTNDEQTAASSFLHGVGPVPIVALGIGAADPRRRWPADRFAALARALHRDHGARLVTIGGPGDRDIEAALRRALAPADDAAVIPLAGRASVRETAAVLERCSLFVGNDSGPMHIAAAVGTPCVEISCHSSGASPLHHNAPERFHPWGVPHVVVRPHVARSAACADGCVASIPDCILDVGVDEVLRACDRLLEAHASTPRR